MMVDRQSVGVLGESIARTFLERKGFKFITQNFRRKWGEIDLILEREGVVHFVEVKAHSVGKDAAFSRENSHDPEEMATELKLEKVARTAALYMEDQHDEREFQVDLVTVRIDHETRTARCRYYPQVLEE